MHSNTSFRRVFAPSACLIAVSPPATRLPDLLGRDLRCRGSWTHDRPLQTAVIVMALPFSIVMIGLGVATVQAFHQEHQAFVRAQQRQARRELREQVEDHVEQMLAAHTRRREPAHWLSDPDLWELPTKPPSA